MSVKIFDIIPVGDSAESAQNSEPSLAVNPNNPMQIIAGSFAVDTPFFLTTDGGTTWSVYAILVNNDKSLAWKTDGSGFLASTLKPTTRVRNSYDIPTYSGTVSGSGFGAPIDIFAPNRPDFLDQPWVRTGPSNHVYVAYNNLNNYGTALGQGKTASVNFSADGGNTFTPFVIDRVGQASGGPGQDAPAVRLAVNGSTVYAVFVRWDSLVEDDTAGSRYRSHVVVVRSDNAGADSFTALGTGGIGSVVAQTIAPFSNTDNSSLTLGQERTGSDLAIAVDPSNDAASTALELDDWQRANLRAMRRLWQDAAGIPKELTAAAARAAGACEAKWRQARAENDFSVVKDSLSDMVAIWREIAAEKARFRGGSPYDALVKSHEPDSSADEIAAIMAEIETWLPELIGEGIALQQSRSRQPLALKATGSHAQQQTFLRHIIESIGFDFGQGRFDESRHPGYVGQQGDIRITGRWDDETLLFGIKAVLHETGHALYERGMPEEWRRQPVGVPQSKILHESQALFYEVQVARSEPFLEWLSAEARRRSPEEGRDPAWSAENLRLHYRQVSRSLIRIDADELTYPCHVIMRFRLERELIEGGLTAADLPSAWNELSHKLLGVVPADHCSGCLQDIHWYEGNWGYFAIYVPGAVAAAQLFEAAENSDPQFADRIRAGDFRGLASWLATNVYAKGSRWTAQEILQQATGRPLDPNALRRHLERRYLAAA
jgi:carboxypeptidase Taq